MSLSVWAISAEATVSAAMALSTSTPAALDMHVQQSCVGFLIGKGGESMKAIQSLSGANLQVGTLIVPGGASRAQPPSQTQVKQGSKW